MVYKCVNNLTPDYLRERFKQPSEIYHRDTRRKSELALPKCRLTFAFRGAKIFNSLPKFIRDTETLGTEYIQNIYRGIQRKNSNAVLQNTYRGIQTRKIQVIFSLLFASLPSLDFDIFFRCLFCSIPTFGWTLLWFYTGTQMMSSLPLKKKS